MKRKSTKLGKFLKRHCIECDMTMGELAIKLGLTQSFISAVNVGKKSFPDNKIEHTISILKLKDEEKELFISLVQDWKTSFTFRVVGFPDGKRTMVALFVRKLSTLSSDKVKQMLKLLEK